MLQLVHIFSVRCLSKNYRNEYGKFCLSKIGQGGKLSSHVEFRKNLDWLSIILSLNLSLVNLVSTH